MNSNLPGMTWQSLASLPDWLNAQWTPIGIPSNELALLKKLALPPIKPEFVDDAKAEIASLIKGETALPSSECRAEGQPRLGWYPYPLQFIYGAGNVMIQEAFQVRAISVAGGTHSAQLRDPNALVGLPVNGDVKGHWDGETLVVDTVSVREDINTFYGIPNDPDLHVVERYRLVNKNTLERETTVTAPLYFSKPWVYRVTYKRGPAGSLASTFCEPKGGWFSATE
ncbi:MAG: hypothetical protein QM808_04155 [Steroidobacteraceae bacterium]